MELHGSVGLVHQRLKRTTLRVDYTTQRIIGRIPFLLRLRYYMRQIDRCSINDGFNPHT